MGLRDFLQKMQGTTEVTKGFQDSTGQLVQQQARSRFAEAFPKLGPQAMAGDTDALSQLNAIALEMGSNEPVSAINQLQQMRMAAEAKNKPVDMEALKVQQDNFINLLSKNRSVSEEEEALIRSQKNQDDLKDAFKTVQGQRDFGVKQKDSELREWFRNFDVEQKTQNKFVEFTKDFNKEKTVIESKEKFNTAMQIKEMAIGDSVLGRQGAKRAAQMLANVRGILTDPDAAELAGSKTIQNKMARMQAALDEKDGDGLSEADAKDLLKFSNEIISHARTSADRIANQWIEQRADFLGSDVAGKRIPKDELKKRLAVNAGFAEDEKITKKEEAFKLKSLKIDDQKLAKFTQQNKPLIDKVLAEAQKRNNDKPLTQDQKMDLLRKTLLKAVDMGKVD